MFEDVQRAYLDGMNSLTLERSGKRETVPRDCVQMILEVDQLTACTELWNDEHGWRRPNEPDAEPLKGMFDQAEFLKHVPYPEISPSQTRQHARARGSARLVDASLYGVDRSGAVAAVDEFALRIEVSDKPGCKVLVNEDGCHVICLLSDDQFSQLLRHVFLSSGTWKAQVVIGTIGFQRQADAAYSDGAHESFIIETDRMIMSELRRISVFNG